jgi:all-trans-retinol dehydrogenase (NAD+)
LDHRHPQPFFPSFLLLFPFFLFAFTRGDTMELQGATAVITGGAMGIGLATAHRLIARGCAVALWDIQPDALANAARELHAKGGTVYTYICDVTDKAAVYATAARTISAMGQVDILINNAGFVRGGSFLSLKDTDDERTVGVNITALLYTIRAFLPGMYERDRGHIVNISSAAGLLGVPDLSVYAATKWAVYGLTESMRFEAQLQGKNGVRWSSIHPSYLAHGMFEGARLGLLGNLIVPLVKDHDVIAKTIVEAAIIKGRHSPKRPVTLHLTPRVRALLPDSWFQTFLTLLGVPDSMRAWKGRGHA